MAEAGPVVRFGDLAAEYRVLAGEIDPAVRETMASGWFVLGSRVARFETEFAAWLSRGAEPVRAVGCASGTEAIALALRALGIRAGATVVTVPNTCAPTAAGIRMTGATLRFVDVDPVHLLMDEAALLRTLEGGGVDAVVPVHLFGAPAPIGRIATLCRARGVAVVEDCAQSHGATVGGRATGTFGDAAAFSFYPSKNLGAYGDGGAVVVRDEVLAERVVRLRNYGYEPARRDWAVEEGLNSRLDEMQAAILSVKLRHLDRWNETRRAIAARYDAALAGRDDVRPVAPPPGTTPSRHLYVVRTPHRDALRAHLDARGVQTGIHYPDPVHLQPAYSGPGCPPGAFPVAERAAREVLSLPLHPFLPEGDVSRVLSALADFPRQRG